MSESETKPQYEDVPTSTIALAGLIGSILVLAMIVLLMVVYYQADARQRQSKIDNEPPEEWTRLRTDQEGKLAEYAWLDQKAGSVVIPIERAKTLVVEEINAHGEPKRIRRVGPPAKPAAKPATAPKPPGNAPASSPAEKKPGPGHPEPKKPRAADLGPA